MSTEVNRPPLRVAHQERVWNVQNRLEQSSLEPQKLIMGEGVWEDLSQMAILTAAYSPIAQITLPLLTPFEMKEMTDGEWRAFRQTAKLFRQSVRALSNPNLAPKAREEWQRRQDETMEAIAGFIQIKPGIEIQTYPDRRLGGNGNIRTIDASPLDLSQEYSSSSPSPHFDSLGLAGKLTRLGLSGLAAVSPTVPPHQPGTYTVQGLQHPRVVADEIPSTHQPTPQVREAIKNLALQLPDEAIEFLKKRST